MYKKSRVKNSNTKRKQFKGKLFKGLNHTLKGGKYLGEGTYGCVVSPAIQCKKNLQNPRTKLNNKQLSKSVSKIVMSSREHKTEIDISNKLKKLDPQQQYFITFEDACYLKEIPKERSNTVSVEYNNDSLENYDIINNKKKMDKQFCKIDMRYKPINLVMPYGGSDLFDILDSTKNSPQLTEMRKLTITNFKQCFKNLLQGILKMHEAGIVNRDIKIENIMVKYNESTRSVVMRFIDFGLSDVLSPEFCSQYNNISMHGTEGLIPPEIIISYYLTNKAYFSNVKDKINKGIKYIKDILATDINEYKMVSQIDTIVQQLYNRIQTEINNKTILNRYFGKSSSNQNVDKFNGYLQKGDIFGIGLTMYMFLEIYRSRFRMNEYERLLNVKKNPQLYDLLLHMIELDSDKRYNIIQCLKHPYFA